MPEYLTHFFYEFVTLLVILDPIATIPLFLVAAEGLDRRGSLLVAFYAMVISFLVLMFFIVAGQFLLAALKIPIASFQLAGSLVLLLFGVKMVLGRMDEQLATSPVAATPLQRAVYPLAIPTIAGPGAILTVVLLADNTGRAWSELVATTGVLALCLLVMFVTYALATVVFRFLGKPGIEVVSRVFGLVLASIAVTGMIASIKVSFGLP
ncbi:MarC family protein [Reyranella soli]|uniref:MarC family protein n=1 Tax=Reyranella soli TaxID=1230389 RepID=UPI00147946A0|nr:MarC family protein [Reyranella soli]